MNPAVLVEVGRDAERGPGGGRGDSGRDCADGRDGHSDPGHDFQASSRHDAHHRPTAWPPTLPRWKAARRVLAVRLDGLGDLLMTTPALAALRQGLPRAELVLLSSPGAAALAPHLAGVDAVWPFAAPWVAALPAAGAPTTATPSTITATTATPPGTARTASNDERLRGPGPRALVDEIAAAQFDAAVIFTVCTQSALPAALLLHAAGVPLSLAHSRENPYALLSDWRPETDLAGTAWRHEVRRQLDLVAHVGMHTDDERLRFVQRPADRAALRERLHEQLRAAALPPDRPYVVVHPGATAASRRWPAERFGHTADLIAAERGCTIVFAGGTEDVPRVEQARSAMRRPALSLAGELSLGELAALIDGAALLVANNSAPAHLAAALGTPVVNLYALTNPQHTPWRTRARVLSHDVPCRGCLRSVCPQQHHRCLEGVEAAQAGAAALSLLRWAPRAAAAKGSAAAGRSRGAAHPLEEPSR